MEYLRTTAGVRRSADVEVFVLNGTWRSWLWLSLVLSGEVPATTAVNAPRPMGDGPLGLRLAAVSLP